MNKGIYEFALIPEWGAQLLELPMGSLVVACKARENDEGVSCPTIWVELDPDPAKAKVGITFVIIPTNAGVPDFPFDKHLATIQHDTDVVAHVYTNALIKDRS